MGTLELARRWTRLAVMLSVPLGIAACAGAPGRTAPSGGAVSSGPDPAGGAAADARTVDNLRAFAKLYGYVRYFHPSDAASAVDWERFAVYGAGRVKDAATAEELRGALEALFGPIAPTVQIYPADGPAPALPAALTPADTAGLELVAWQHEGVGLGSIHLYRSIRLHREAELIQLPAIAVLTQQVDATPYRGMEVRLEAAARVVGPTSRARLSLQVRGEDGGTAYADDVVVMAAEWQRYAIEGRVADDAATIVVTGRRDGPATASFDDFRLLVRAGAGDAWSPVPLRDPGFEEGAPGRAPAGWSAAMPGDQVRVVEGDAYTGSRHVALVQPPTVRLTEPLFDARPGPGEVVERPLGSGLVARIPLALYSRDGRTLRPDGAPPVAALAAELERVALDRFTAADEALRYANVIIVWNVMQHFYPYFDVVEVDWDAVLTETLRRARGDRGPEDFLRTLRLMLVHLADGHGRVDHPVTRTQARLPFLVDLVEGRVVVVAAGAGEGACVERGDIVVSIDGVPAEAALREAERYLSGSPQWNRVRALRAFGQGEHGTRARLVLERPDGAAVCDVVRDSRGLVREPRPAPIEELRDGIFYVDLDRAPLSAIVTRIAELAAADGVIFDMRGYPAGNHAVLQFLTDDTLYSAELKTPRHIYPDRMGRAGHATNRWTLPPLQPRFRGRAVFITDGRAISYAETLMGIVEHYRLGEIVGQPTGGVNGDQNPFSLPGGFDVYWTGKRVDKHDGSPLHNVGVLPTVPVERSLAGVRAGRDELLERALELLGGA